MGEPGRGHALPPAPESIRCGEATGGTETSKYPEEEKSTEIARVAASESAPAQTRASVKGASRCRPGVAGTAIRGLAAPGAVTKGRGSGRAWEGPPERATAPYAKPRPPREPPPE